MKKLLFSVIMLLWLGFPVMAQSNQEWIFLSHSQKISDKFDLLADFQARSDNGIKYVSTALLRAAIAYNLNQHQSIALGYAYKGDWMQGEPEDEYNYENRIYQQYQYNFQLSKVELSLRARFEQRFLQEERNKFTMRARAFISAQLPLIANKELSKGLYVGLQNELFLNVYKKNNVNNHIFDQNRPYISLGYMFSKKIDAAFDYGLMSDQDAVERKLVNIFRISLTTNF